MASMICSECRKDKPRSEFPPERWKGQCLACRAAYQKRWRQTKPDGRADEKAASRARSRAPTRLGRLHPDEYERLTNEERAADGLPPLHTLPLGRPRKVS